MSAAVHALALLPAILAAPLSESDITSAVARLKQLQDFTAGFAKVAYEDYITTCKAGAQDFNRNCSSLSESVCKASGCYRKGDQDVEAKMMGLSESACDSFPGNHTWHADRLICELGVAASINCSTTNYTWEKPKDFCCKDESKECKYNATGHEASCCDQCLTEPDKYATFCKWDQFMGITLLGTEPGQCDRCIAGEAVLNKGSKSDCESNGGICAGFPGCGDSVCCASFNGNWTAGVWTRNTTAITEKLCRQPVCGNCSGVGGATKPDSKAGCEMSGVCSVAAADFKSCNNSGGNWTPATWTVVAGVETEDACKSQSLVWATAGEFEGGDSIPLVDTARGLNASAAYESHGGAHDLESSMCVDPAKFQADALAGKTAAQAFAADPAYYRDQVAKAFLTRAHMLNNATAAVRSGVTFLGYCFLGLVDAVSNGAVGVKTTSSTYALIVNPRNLADADPMLMEGHGNVSVLGGNNKGAITFRTYGFIEVVGVENSGPIQADDSSGIVIANVTNLAGGTVVAQNVTASLLNVVNWGRVTGAGEFAAYNITNYGIVKVTGAGSTLDLTLLCAPGTVEVGQGVSGKITYPADCGVTVTNNAGSAMQVVQTLSGRAKNVAVVATKTAAVETFSGVAPTAEQLLASAAYKLGKQKGLADAIGVDKSKVFVIGFTVKAVRRLVDGTGRRLSTVQLHVTTDFEVEAADDAAAQEVAKTLGSAGIAATIQAKTNTALAAQDWSGAGGALSAAPSMAEPTLETKVKGQTGSADIAGARQQAGLCGLTALAAATLASWARA